MHPTIEDPFTIILTVPRALVGDDVDATAAVDPVLSAKFGWDHYDVVDPRDHDDVYQAAFEKFRSQAPVGTARVELVDPARALVHVVAEDAPEGDVGQDVFVRVVRVFPVAFPVGPMLTTVGIA